MLEREGTKETADTDTAEESKTAKRRGLCCFWGGKGKSKSKKCTKEQNAQAAA